jgi:hypothetical protein
MRTLLVAALMTPFLVQAQHAGHHDHARMVAGPASTAVPAEARAQWDLLARSVARYRDFEVAKREGWKRFGGDSPLMGEHWYLDGAPEPKPGEPLDFTRPSNLQYAVVDGKRELVGVSYVVRIGVDDPLPEGFAGNADHWHVHDAEKFVAAATEERPFLRWLANGWMDREYRDQGDHRARLAMAHAWVTLPSPDGPFSMHNSAIPYLRVGLPAAFAAASGEDAANGVNLASAEGCKEALDAELWIADAAWAQSRTLRRHCQTLAEQMRGVIALNRDDAQAVNRAARKAWNSLKASKQATLTPKQRERIATLTEHDPMH